MEEETVVERETRIVKCERLALVWGSGDDNLSDAHIFIVGACPRPPAPSVCGFDWTEKYDGVTFYLLIETVEQTLLIVLRNNLEPCRRKKVAHAILDFIRERNSDVDRPARRRPG